MPLAYASPSSSSFVSTSAGTRRPTHPGRRLESVSAQDKSRDEQGYWAPGRPRISEAPGGVQAPPKPKPVRDTTTDISNPTRTQPGRPVTTPR